MNATARARAARWLAALLLFPAVLTAAPALIVDGDADGVSDERDDCPYSPSGEWVNADGCRIDSDADKDGVLDLADLCPYSITGSRVDAEGCALDDDFDGIANGRDLCPDTALGERVDVRGCDPGAPGSARTAVAAAGGSLKRGSTAPARAVATAQPIPVALVAKVQVEQPAAAKDVVLAPAEAPTVSASRSATVIDAGRSASSAVVSRHLPAAPQIVLTPSQMVALQHHPAVKPGDFAPSLTAVAVAKTPQSSAAPVSPVSAPVSRRLPSAPQVTLSPDEARTVAGRVRAPTTRAARVP